MSDASTVTAVAATGKRAGGFGRLAASRSPFEWAGIGAGVILIVFGIAAVALGYNGKRTVVDSLKSEHVVGSTNMTSATVSEQANAAGLTGVKLPTCSVAGEPINSAAKARCFATHMRIHVLEATGGKTYAQLPMYATKDGKGTNDAVAALQASNGRPLDDPRRTLWINEIALSTALNSSYMADQLANFGIVVGIALLLSGIGFVVIAAKGLGARRIREETA